MKRIVHVLNDLSTFFTHRKSLIDLLMQSHDVVILAPDHLDHSALNKNGYKVLGYPLSRKGLNPLAEWRTFTSLRKHYLALSPDAVHHFTIKPVIYGTLAARSANIKLILNTITGLGYVFTGLGLIPKLLRPVVKLLYRIALKSPRVRVIFQNADDMQLFVSQGLVDQEQSTVVPGSGVNTDKFRPSQEPAAPPYRVALPARMLWDKGIGEFVEAARLLLARRRDLEFVLVGGLDPGNRMAIPEPTIREWEKEGLVRWLGRVEDMPSVYQNSHIICLPSYREGLPMSLLEAAACGKPIITTRAPGCQDVVHGQNEALVPRKDSRSLAKALEKLIEQPNLRDQLAKANLHRAQTVFSQKIVNETIKGLMENR